MSKGGIMTAAAGRVIRRLRQQQLLTVREFAKKHGLSCQSIYNMESGRSEPTMSTLRKLAADLEIAPAEMYRLIAEESANNVEPKDAQ